MCVLYYLQWSKLEIQLHIEVHNVKLEIQLPGLGFEVLFWLWNILYMSINQLHNCLQ